MDQTNPSSSANEPGTPAPRKLVCLETYWGDHNTRMFQDTSVLPFLQALGRRLDPPLALAHRHVESLAHLARYTAHPDGILWRDPETFDVPVFYLSFHGAPGTLRSAMERLEPAVLIQAFRNWGRSFPNLVYFSACSVLAGAEGSAFARAFLAESGCRAVLGYATDVDWTESMLVDMLFLNRYYRDPDPWTNLAAIHASVLADFAPARRLGFELYSA